MTRRSESKASMMCGMLGCLYAYAADGLVGLILPWYWQKTAPLFMLTFAKRPQPASGSIDRAT